jgi:hypothetical protein
VRQEAIAAHELARLAHTALRDAAALTKGAEPASLREPAQRTGQAVAVWTAELLQRPRREVGLGESLPATPHPGAAGGGRGGGAAR